MTSFKTENFNFYTFDPNNPYHINFVNELMNDADMHAYLRQFYKYLSKPDTKDTLNSAFLVGEKDNIIGYINLINVDKIEEIHLGIHPNFRGIKNSLGETYAYRIVKETSDSLFANYKLIEYLRLFIDKKNIRSISLAEKCGFNLFDETKDYFEYRKYSKHQKSIITPHFKFLTFDKDNQEHLKVLALLAKDEEIKKWFGDLNAYFDEMINGEGLEGTYLVLKDSEIIGFMNIYDYYKLLELQYGLLEEYRGKSLGFQLLKESSEEIFKRYFHINTLRTYIDRENIRSEKAAINAGFKLISEKFNIKEYHKVR